ncbi:uncharacterized protein LOC133833968 [Humulus lupulus]|uniref:uncharacterized protein LOC133833968 n=1 Tax=Humulus lupulus TaxID=3486 RepID=UPI002B40B336|nr:uncharacterized protein LOC133833968 [Humulus lupulus]
MGFPYFLGRALFASVFIFSAHQDTVVAAMAIKGLGGILFIFGSSTGAYLLLLHQMIATPLLYIIFMTMMAMMRKRIYSIVHQIYSALYIWEYGTFGALLFFIGMKSSVPKKLHKKKVNKTKNF